MKAILMSIKPQHVANILNGIKTQEIRKRFPNDYVGWVYIYVTKNQNEELWWYDGTEDFRLYKKGIANERDIGWHLQNGKVIARFWCDKVEDFEFCEFSKYKDNLELYNECIRKDKELCKKACISYIQMIQYLDTKAIGKDMFGKAIHITKLEIFDKPKEISEFYKWTDKTMGLHVMPKAKMVTSLTRAPQSWQFIEVDL